MYHLDSIRLGFACNSSSSHDIIWFPTMESLEEYQDLNLEEGQYGWSDFVLASPIEKLKYLAVDQDRHACEIVPDLKKTDTPYDKGVWSSELLGWEEVYPYIDHESAGITRFIPGGIKEKLKILETPNILIKGGNDNSGGSFYLPSLRGYSLEDSKVYRDALTETVVFFHPPSGNKFRWTKFNKKYTKSPHPELVDLKITDYCDQGCEFCYQNSSSTGQHAPLDRVLDIINQLASMGTFEIAIGGGEPTTHPNFEEILKHAVSKGLVVNYTTRKIPKVQHLHHVGACALSISSVEEIEKALSHKYRGDYTDFSGYVTFQYVLGTNTDQNLKRIIDFCDAKKKRLTLLGFKKVGRGEKFRPFDQTESWISMVKNTKSRAIAIDTLIAQQCADKLVSSGISPKFFSLKEGAFSCYIDACTNSIAPSSYCGYTEPLTDILAQFRQYPGEDVACYDRLNLLLEG